MNNSFFSNRLTRRRFVGGVAATATGLAVVKLTGARDVAAAGSIRQIYGSHLANVTAPAKSFDLVQIVQDFQPLAFLGWHSHDFPVFALIAAGQATLKRQPGGNQYYQAGKGARCGPGLHTMGNEIGNSTMRRIVVLLNPPGVPAAVPGTGPFTPLHSPTNLFPASRANLAAPPPEFDLAQSLVSLEPGAISSPYTAAGNELWTVLQGELRIELAGATTTYGPGQFVHLGPGQKAVAANVGTSEAQLAVSMVLPAGRPAGSLTATVPSIRPPGTGDGGLR